MTYRVINFDNHYIIVCEAYDLFWLWRYAYVDRLDAERVCRMMERQNDNANTLVANYLPMTISSTVSDEPITEAWAEPNRVKHMRRGLQMLAPDQPRWVEVYLDQR